MFERLPLRSALHPVHRPRERWGRSPAPTPAARADAEHATAQACDHRGHDQRQGPPSRRVSRLEQLSSIGAIGALMNRVRQPRPLVVLGLNVWMGTAAGADELVEIPTARYGLQFFF